MKNITRTVFIMLVIVAGMMLFQAQNSWVGWDEDPN